MKISKCEGGQDVFATVRENSPVGEFIANLTFTGDPSASHLNLSLTGENADWFWLEGKTIRLNSSITRVLDREVHGPILIATLSCYEDGAIQSEHRIAVEILNINDNKPEFLQDTIQPIEISELTTVNSVAFTVRATDADGDTLIYGIDETSPDASYFRVDLPNSGRIVLNRSLDYETKTQLQLHLYVAEMNTKEHYNTTATLTINVTDGDDQYPQFQPCKPLSFSQSICVNPLYTVNITEQDEDVVLDFSPGPILAVDGDEGLRTPLTYTILSGADNGRFVIDSETGEVRLTKRVENRLLTPTLRLHIMASQIDDPMKYSVATALVRVLAENRFPPQFGRSTYHGFVSESTSPATLVNTYGNELLILEATDRDFTDGFNPKLQYSLTSDSNSSQSYYITQEGLLIAKANQLQPNHKHSLEVLAADQESGDVVKAVIDIEVLQKGVPVPQGPLEEGQPYGSGTVGRTGGVVGVCLILLAIALFVLVYFLKKRRQRQDPANRANVAEGKHPNVVNHGRPQPHVEEAYYHNEAFSGYDASTSTLHGTQGFYTKAEQDSGKDPQPKVSLPSDVLTLTTPTTEDTFPAVKTNGKLMDKPISKSVSFQDFVVVRECDSQVDEDRERSDSAGLEDINIDLIGISIDLDGVTVDTEESSANPESINIGPEKINTASVLETPDMDLNRARKDLDIENANSEKPGIGQLGISDPKVEQEAPEETGQTLRNLDLPEPIDRKLFIPQEDKSNSNQTKTDVGEGVASDNTASKDASKADTLSTAESDTIKPNMIKPDVSNTVAEIPDVQCSTSKRPDTATNELETVKQDNFVATETSLYIKKVTCSMALFGERCHQLSHNAIMLGDWKPARASSDTHEASPLF
ncbi:cadherin-related family member 5 [Colossoma macropomum]|uniref:cadherin-related family member 5 n=1 Tax=Colossoma macropomum TaxID=42526 RepID=UPI001864A687|nr:cadherin-related family member 5 [Colossoma macropomum]